MEVEDFKKFKSESVLHMEYFLVFLRSRRHAVAEKRIFALSTSISIEWLDRLANWVSGNMQLKWQCSSIRDSMVRSKILANESPIESFFGLWTVSKKCKNVLCQSAIRVWQSLLYHTYLKFEDYSSASGSPTATHSKANFIYWRKTILLLHCTPLSNSFLFSEFIQDLYNIQTWWKGHGKGGFPPGAEFFECS